MNKIYLEEINSTNSYMLQQLSDGVKLEEGSVIYTMKQTAGRGQVGNSWESEDGKNVAFSLLLRPTFLPIRNQFIISEIVCVAIHEALTQCGLENVSIKWPNDIYCGDDKICGILIENSLVGSSYSLSVVGIGINVNQMTWIGNAPNPTSMKICAGRDFDPVAVMEMVAERITHYYNIMKTIDAGVWGGMCEAIHKNYMQHLYRKDGLHPYKDAETGKEFMARIKTIEPSGYLQLEDPEGSMYRYMFKEVKFVLPCGVTKE